MIVRIAAAALVAASLAAAPSLAAHAKAWPRVSAAKAAATAGRADESALQKRQRGNLFSH